MIRIFLFLVPMHTFANYNANDILKTVDEAKVEEEDTTPPTNSHFGVRVFLESISNFYKFKKKNSFCAMSWVQSFWSSLCSTMFGAQPLADNFWRKPSREQPMGLTSKQHTMGP